MWKKRNEPPIVQGVRSGPTSKGEIPECPAVVLPLTLVRDAPALGVRPYRVPHWFFWALSLLSVREGVAGAKGKHPAR